MLTRNDRGAAAVEFALVVPLLLLLTIGIVAFGQAFHVQTVLDNAARDAVRTFTLTREDPGPAALQVAQDAAASAVTLSAGQVSIPSDCPSGTSATVAITLEDFTLLGGMWTVDLTGSGTMRCNG